MERDLKMINDDFTILVRHEFRKEVDKMLFDMGYSFKLDAGENFYALEKENLFYFIDYKSKTIVKKKQISFLNDRGVFMSLHKLRKIWRKHRRQEGVNRAVKEGKFKGKQEYIDKGVIRSAMAEKGSTYRNVAESLNVSLSTVYRAMLGYRKIDLERKGVTEEACDFSDGYYKISVEKSNISKTQDLLLKLDEKQEKINQLHMEIEGLKSLIFPPENKELDKIILSFCGYKLKITK